mmetsp:Transcript_29462/g.101892  ORF Transcript_29462/g.101892 Transcript_29462/m.101892 type:complete len:395 (+) Transcript_29462:635-1819(+)
MSWLSTIGSAMVTIHGDVPRLYAFTGRAAAAASSAVCSNSPRSSETCASASSTTMGASGRSSTVVPNASTPTRSCTASSAARALLEAAAAAAAAWAPGRITLRMAAMGALGPRRRICVLFPDESDSALDQLKSVDAKLRDAASDVLGYALFGAQGGAANRAAALVVCLASLEKRMKRNDFDREHIVAVAGLGSAGEIAALVFAGSLTLEDALHLIEARHAALEVVGNSALAATSVIGVELTVVEKLLPEGLAVTHHLFGRGFVVAGGTAELDAFEAAVGACSAQTQRLAAPYFGAHSPQAFAAVGAFSAAVEAADVSDARYDVYSSSSSEDDDAPCRDASDLARRVSASLDGPVRWQQTCERLVRDGATHFVEASHSTHLRAFMGQIDPAAVFL